MEFFQKVKETKTKEGAIELLRSIITPSPQILQAIEFSEKSHEGQLRKSGEPYVVHPLLVATITAYYGGDEAMIISALLHDVVEDTHVSLQELQELFGEDVVSLVDSMTKIVALRDEELAPSTSNEKLIASALSFRKILIASIKDIRALVIKLCDRLHNMLTLDALPQKKQMRIAEETLVVYAPIAHRLGISSIKNELEDLCFYYIFPNEYGRIDNYLKENHQSIKLRINNFMEKIRKLLMNNGIPDSAFNLSSRVKRHYSIYLKMQRKGVSMDEVLDLLAVRILVNNPIECYKVLGIIHLNFKPIVARFKDYIAIPKENGYQTIHTTVFDNTSIFEVQIRTLNMHQSAEYGVAAHWKYKSGGISPNLDWLENLQFQNTNIEEFYELVKNDLYSEDISVFSPDGDTFTLPYGATALDFAYAVHSEVGNCAQEAYINKVKNSLLTVLKNGDIVKIITAKHHIPRCSWLDALKTSKAKSHLKQLCANRIKYIDKKSAVNILATLFELDCGEIENMVEEEKLTQSIYKVVRDISYFKEVKNRLKNRYKKGVGLFKQLKIRILKLKPYKFDNIIIYSNLAISDTIFDYCCHPKQGDNIIAFKHGSKAVVHHKLCDQAYEELHGGCAKMVYAEWVKDKLTKYKIVASIDSKKGSLAQFLQFLSKNNINVISIELGRNIDNYARYCDLSIESEIKDLKTIKNLLSQKASLIEAYYEQDAYGARD